MRIQLSNHFLKRAWERMAWGAKDAKAYWKDHVDETVFNEGPGLYRVRVGGMNWLAAYYPEKNTVKIVSMVPNDDHDTAWIAPLRDEERPCACGDGA